MIAVDREKLLKILNGPKTSKERLRMALASSLGVEYKPAKKEKPVSLFTQCCRVFMDIYKQDTGVDYAFSGKDGKALKELINKIETVQGVNEDVLVTFESMLRQLPDWYKKNAYSLPVVNGKFNEIIANIRNGKKQSISEDYKERIHRDLQS